MSQTSITRDDDNETIGNRIRRMRRALSIWVRHVRAISNSVERPKNNFEWKVSDSMRFDQPKRKFYSVLRRNDDEKQHEFWSELCLLPVWVCVCIRITCVNGLAWENFRTSHSSRSCSLSAPKYTRSNQIKSKCAKGKAKGSFENVFFRLIFCCCNNDSSNGCGREYTIR